MSGEKRARRGAWPPWLAPLRPDDVARARMRSAILERAAGWFEGRRPASAWELAEAAARRLAPLAACAVLLFGWMAHRAGRDARTEAANVAVEALVRTTEAQGPPAVLTSASPPGDDLVLAATLRGEE